MDLDGDGSSLGAYRSVIGFSYLEPVTTLLEALLASHPQGVNDLQASPRENGYSVSIIALTVLCLESILRSVMHDRNISQVVKPHAFFEQTFGASGLAEECLELFVLRDTIAHNHLWIAQHAWNDELTVLSADRLPQNGDKKYMGQLDSTTRQTKLLGLNLFPTRIHLADVRKVLKTFVAIMQYLHGVDHSIVSLWGIRWVRFQRSGLYFADLVMRL